MSTSNESEDEARRKLLKPKVSPDEALSILIDLYLADGFDVKADLPRAEVIKELDSYDDVNFLVKIDGEKALLKIHNGVESEQYITAHARKRARQGETDTPGGDGSSSSSSKASIIDLQSSIFSHLATPKYDVTAGTTIPIKKSSSDGDDNSVGIRELNVVSAEHSPQQLVVRLQSWVDGTPLCDIKWFPIETLVDCGACLGRMCHAFDELATSDSDALDAAKRYENLGGLHT